MKIFFNITFLLIFLIGCGQQNFGTRVQKSNESIEQVIVVDEGAIPIPDETPYYNEVVPDTNGNDNNTGTDSGTDTTLPDNNTDTVTYTSYLGTIYRNSLGEIVYLNESGTESLINSFSSQATATINSISFPRDAYQVEIRGKKTNKLVQTSLNQAPIMTFYADQINLIEAIQHPERKNLEETYDYFTCGKIYIEDQPIVQGTIAIYIEDPIAYKKYRIYYDLLNTTVLAKYILLYNSLNASGDTNGCVYTNTPYFYNYELPEYRKIIEIVDFTIGW